MNTVSKTLKFLIICNFLCGVLYAGSLDPFIQRWHNASEYILTIKDGTPCHDHKLAPAIGEQIGPDMENDWVLFNELFVDIWTPDGTYLGTADLIYSNGIIVDQNGFIQLAYDGAKSYHEDDFWKTWRYFDVRVDVSPPFTSDENWNDELEDHQSTLTDDDSDSRRESGGSLSSIGYPSSELQQDEEIIEELFHSNSLLIRGISETEVFEDICFTHKPKLGSFGSEMRAMREDGGLAHASSTLLVPDKSVQMYKPLAFLFDGRSSELTHIYGIDSNSCTSVEGQLSAGSDLSMTFTTLEALAEAIKETALLDKSKMNEVNGTFWQKDLVGLAAKSVNNPLQDAVLNLKIRAIQKLILEKFKLNLPVYKYTEEGGKLEKLDEKADAIFHELRLSRGDCTCRRYLHIIQEFLLEGSP